MRCGAADDVPNLCGAHVTGQTFGNEIDELEKQFDTFVQYIVTTNASSNLQIYNTRI